MHSTQQTCPPLHSRTTPRTFPLLSKPPLACHSPEQPQTLHPLLSKPLSACHSRRPLWTTYLKPLAQISASLSHCLHPWSRPKWKQQSHPPQLSSKKCSSTNLQPPPPTKYPPGKMHKPANYPRPNSSTKRKKPPSASN